MWKWFKRLIVLVIVVFFAVAALLIPDKIDSQDQLKKCINTNIPCRFSPGGYWWGVPFIRWGFN